MAAWPLMKSQGFTRDFTGLSTMTTRPRLSQFFLSLSFA
jgi:hypothetical protein